ncbi:MAG: 1-phosphofructokinase family hexose kinase [Flavobacteriaceae bacterium]
MNRIITLTVNPAIDKSTTVVGMRPNSKLRCAPPVFEAGGGGVNVSVVLKELGVTSLCAYLAGGPTGTHLETLLKEVGVPQQIIPIAAWTRENLAVTDTTNNQQYRFGMPGPLVTENEWQGTLEQLDAVLAEGDLLVSSGSLCPGMPTDFYAQVAAITKKKKVKLILDTSDDALLQGVRAGGVYLLKPNIGELAKLCDMKSLSFLELESAAKKLLEAKTCEVLVISLGAQGALLVAKEIMEYIPAPVVHQKSTIGAGDSMVAGMVFALAKGKSLSEMAKFGVACGTAATMTEGTQLCKKKDAEDLYEWIINNPSGTSQVVLDA